MTSIEMRGNALFRRNEFAVAGPLQIPVIERQKLDLKDIELISYSDIKTNDTEQNRSKGVHFFIDDYRFEGIYRNPEKSFDRLSQYRFLLTPDFSVYSDMNYWRQIESVAHNRWVGAYWQSKGITVIPTVSWGAPRTYEFCFDGIEKGSIVAIGMIGCKKNKVEFLRGFNEMLNQISPEGIICFGTPFDEMQGNIVSVQYWTSRKVVR